MDRRLDPADQEDFDHWSASMELSSDAVANEALVAFQLAQLLDQSPMSVLRASRGHKGFKDLESKVLIEVTRDPTIEQWNDHGVRRLRFTDAVPRVPMPTNAVPLEEAAAICGCAADELTGYRLRTMAGHRDRGLANDEFDPIEVVAIYLAVGLESVRISQDRIDLFVARLLADPPPGQDWAVDATPRNRRIEIVDAEAIGQRNGRRFRRWLRPDGAFAELRSRGYLPA